MTAESQAHPAGSGRMARRILALLLLVMAAGQLSDLTGFVDVLETYELGSRTTAWTLAIPILLAEAMAGVGLLRRTGIIGQVAPAMAIAVTVGWTVLGTQAFARGLALDNCGCFGVHLAQPLRWWILLEDAEFIALAWWVRRKDLSAASEKPAEPLVTDGTATTAQI